MQQNILKVGRYDWSGSCQPGDPSRLQRFIQDTTGLEVVAEPHSPVTIPLTLSHRSRGFCMLVDADEFGEGFVQTFIRDCPTRRGMSLPPNEAKERLFLRSREDIGGDRDAIGAWMACDYTEYEFGMLLHHYACSHRTLCIASCRNC